MRVLVYEHLSAGGLPDDLSLLREGAAMLRAALDDLAALPGVTPVPVQARSRFTTLAPSCDAALVIAPEFDDILASFAYWFETSTCRLLGPDGDAVRLTADKLALADHLRRAGVPTPATTAVRGVVKPRHGTPLRACTQTIREEGGRLSYQGGSLPIAPDLEVRAVALAARAVEAVPGLKGYYGVDLVLGDNPLDDVVIEINPRLTTSYLGLRALAANNLMAVLLGHEDAPRWREGRVDFTPNGDVTYRAEA
jgi:predicted ATP-grasp superfamily ATP-dependent carboligase